MNQPTKLDKTRRYLVPIGRLQLPSEPDVVHLTVYRWIPKVREWFTGLALCGRSTEGEPLPDGTAVTCEGCLEKKEDYERYLAPGYRPEDDDPKALRERLGGLRKQAEASMALLNEFVTLADVTHKYRIMGGHDALGENHSCSGCELASRVREHLERYR